MMKRIHSAASLLHAAIGVSIVMLAALSPLAGGAADRYPSKPVRVIVPNSPGSTADVVARVVSDGLTEALGQPFFVENNAGAAGIPGTRQLVTASADGYTLGVISSSHAIKPALYPNLPYDTLKDISPVALIGTTPLVLVVSATSPYTSVQSLLVAARARPGSITYGSNGKGSALHLAGELLKAKAGVDLLHVPYKGVNTLMTDIISGQIQTAFLATPSATAQIQSGKLRALAVSTPARLHSLPMVPTLAEAGVRDYSYDAWIAMVGPAGLSPEVISRLHQAVVKVVNSPKVKAVFEAQCFVGDGRGSAEALRTISAEVTKSSALIKSAAITAD